MPSDAAPPAASHFRAAWLGGAVVVAAVVAAYSGSVSVPFLFDDVPSILRNPSIKALGSSLAPSLGTTLSGRPIASLSFALNWALGADRVWGYHAGNIAIHAAAALLLFGLIRRTLQRDSLRASWGSLALPVALVASLVWALHPLQTEAVTYLSQRVESLMGLFCLLTLYAFVRSLDSPGRWSAAWLALSVAACACGMATKEVMVTAPLLVLLYDRTFAAGSWRDAWSRRRIYYACLAGTWLVLAFLVAGTRGRGGTAGFGSGMSAASYFLTQCQAIVHYLRLVVWPAPLVFDYGFRTVHAFGDVWWQALLLAGLAAATLIGLWRRPAAGFLGAWFFGTLAASSSIVPVASQTIAEHRMYLALAAPVLAAVLAVASLVGRRVIWIGSLLAIVLAALTVLRNRDYRTEEALWRDTIAKRPDNPRAYGNLGRALVDAARWQEAIEAARKELAVDPDYHGDAHLILGRALTELGRPAEAVPHFAEALRYHPDSFDVRNNYGVALAALGRWSDAAVQYEEALRLKPGFAEGHNNLANALARAGHLAEALSHYAAAARLQPDFADAESNWGRTLAESGRPAEALPHFERALALRPNAAAHEDLAAALAAAGRTADAIAQYEAAVRLQPDEAAAHYGLANALARVGRVDEAVAHYQAAVRLNPEFAEAHHNLAVALMQLGRPAEALGHFEATSRLLPDSAANHHELALVLGQLGRWDEAVKHDEAALRLQPDFPDAREHLAWLRRQQAGH